MKLILCVHAHQPEGTDPETVERAIGEAYRPFLDAVVRHPQIKVVLSYSGWLLETALRDSPGFVETLRELVDREQVELLSSPMYEPILSVVPERDRVAQIRAHQDLVEGLVGVRPRGGWLPELVWEPSLPLSLGQAGVEYVPLDDTSFLRIGFPERRLYDSYVTEDGGLPIRVFPSPRALRGVIPFAKPEEVVAGLFRRVSAGARVAVFADVAEKFGAWPGTLASVTERQWLSRFFALLGDGEDRVQTCTLAEYVDSFAGAGTVYLPTGATVELLEWSVPPGAQRRHHDLRARLEKEGEGMDRLLGMGFWRNFLTRYPEANWMHKRGLDLDRRLTELESAGHDPERVAEARRHLWRAQCHNAYWHGVTGGVYLPALRDAVYRNQIDAWRIMDEIELGRREPFRRLSHRDVNLDGWEEVVLENRQLAATVVPSDGGSLAALDVKYSGVNVLNTVARREEAYHRAIREGRDGGRGGAIGPAPRGRSGDLARYLSYDPFPLYSVRDHFLPRELSLDVVKNNRTLSMPPARLRMEWEREGEDAIAVRGAFRLKGRRYQLVHRYRLDDDAPILTIDWELRAPDGLPDDAGHFATEWTWGLGGRADGGCRIGINGTGGEPEEEVAGVAADELEVDEPSRALGFSVRSTPGGQLFRFPVETISLSMDRGADRVIQGVRVFFVWPLAPDDRVIQLQQVWTAGAGPAG